MMNGSDNVTQHDTDNTKKIDEYVFPTTFQQHGSLKRSWKDMFPGVHPNAAVVLEKYVAPKKNKES